MKPETYPKDLSDCDAVIHTVGALLEGSEYKSIVNAKLCEKIKNPKEILQ